MINILPAPVFFFLCAGRLKNMLPEVKGDPLSPNLLLEE
jgi:hypothetical protein